MTLEGILAASNHLKTDIKTGSQNDLVQIFGAEFNNKFELDVGNSSSDPSPFSGAAADVLSLGNTDIFGVAQIESDGLANVFVFAANSTLQPMRFRSNAIFTLGSGFVDMSFVFDTSQVIFDKQQVFRGITSTIMVKYGSSVVFNPQRRRLFNANLT